jgi:cobalt-zinc-cadmium efflux system membrane fusion protein
MKTYLPKAYLLILLLCLSCKKEQPADTKTETFALTDTMLAHTKWTDARLEPVKSQLKLFGKIIADENKLVEVFPLVGGNVSDVYVELGDYVEKGKVLAIIRSSEIADFERQMIDAQSDLLVAEKNLRVAEDLFDSKLNAEKDVINARKEVEKAKAELKRVQEVFRIYGLGKTTEYQVKAPISGFIIQKKINRDMQLRSDKSDEIFTIAQINEVWAMANVNESDISRIKEGYQAEVQTISYPDKVFDGKVDKIFNVLDPQTKALKIRVRLENEGFLLKPEMNATVILKYNEGKELKIAIPSQAVIFDKSKNFVMVFKDRQHIETREILLAKQVNGTTYVANGLKEGEKVITKNQLLIYDALND